MKSETFTETFEVISGNRVENEIKEVDSKKAYKCLIVEESHNIELKIRTN
jgi:hypothetical protein